MVNAQMACAHPVFWPVHYKRPWALTRENTILLWGWNDGVSRPSYPPCLPPAAVPAGKDRGQAGEAGVDRDGGPQWNSTRQVHWVVLILWVLKPRIYHANRDVNSKLTYFQGIVYGRATIKTVLRYFIANYCAWVSFACVHVYKYKPP